MRICAKGRSCLTAAFAYDTNVCRAYFLYSKQIRLVQRRARCLSSETVREDIHSLTVSHKGDKGWRDWSMKMLADQAELPYETVKTLLGGKIVRPSFVSVWQIAAALECSLDELSGRKI